MSSLEALFTVDDVVRLVADRDEAQARVDELNSKIEAIRQIIGEDRLRSIVSNAVAPNERSFRAVMEAALGAAPHGLTYAELRQSLRDSGLGEPLERSPNNFHNNVSRLVRLNKAMKFGDRLITPAAYSALPKDMRDILERGGDGEARGAPGMILRVLSSSNGPMTAGEIVEALTSKEEGEPPPSNIYAALSRMAQRGQISRSVDGRYRMPDREHPESAKLF